VRLYYIPTTAAMAPHAALAEAGADYELVLVERDESGTSSAEYLAINPWGRVPALVDGDLLVTEAAATVLHIADSFPEARLAPPVGTPERAEVYRYLMYLTNTVQAGFMHFFYPERYTNDPAAEAAIRAREGELLSEHFDWLDLELEGRSWLVGDERTVADLYLFMLVRWGRRLDPKAWDRPNLRRHFVATLALPGVARMMAEQEIEPPELG
jgi:glutathione S-transferase